MELMSPAGNRDAFSAALENGADAVYLGLNMFNARKPAKNFRIDELPDILELAHSRDVRVYITLNIDLKTSELEDAASILLYLKKSGTDAVIVKDLGLIYILNKYLTGVEYHLSTQFGIANSKAMAAAENIGASRVVLARELNRDEFKYLVKPYFPKTEVFVQGSMCFSFSGRCLMSSWFGGRSANRGSCQAPCRFRFRKDGSDEYKAYFSMKDLNLSEKLSELQETGISALKIEGRLKSANWVGSVTRYYRSLLNGEKSEGTDPSNFSGREQGEGFFGGLDKLITGQNFGSVAAHEARPYSGSSRTVGQGKYDLCVRTGTELKLEIFSDHGNTEFSVRHKAVRNENRGTYLSELESRIRNTAFGGLFLGRFELDNDILIPKSQLNNIISEIGSTVAPLSRKEKKFLKNVKLPPKLEYELNNFDPDPKNTLDICFQNTNILKIASGDIAQIMDDVKDRGIKKVIVTEPSSSFLYLYKKLASKVRVEISFFPILFEKDLEECAKMIEALEHTNSISYEVNDIGHIKLLKNSNKKIDCGPGLSPYNILAAKQLKELGLSSAHLPFESDAETLEGLKYSPLPLRMTIYSRIPLFYTRSMSDNFPDGSTFSDRECFRFSVRKYNGITMFISDEHFTIEGAPIPDVRAHEIIIDLTGEDNILYKFEKLKKDPALFPGLNFNLGRKLF